MPGTVAWQRQGLGDACQSDKMATLLNSLFLEFQISFLNYRVKYFDFIVKWCSRIACNWCASMDFGIISALNW